MRNLVTLLLTLTISTPAFAECPNHLRMDKGDTSPCSGHFFNDESEKQIRKEVRDNELRKQKIDLKDLQIDNLKEDRDRWKESAKHQAEVRHGMQNDLMYGFLGGVGVSILIIIAAGMVNK